LQKQITVCQKLFLLYRYLASQIIKCLLNLPLRDIVLFGQISNLFFYLTFFNHIAFDIGLIFIDVVFNFWFDYWLWFSDSLNIMVLMFTVNHTLRADTLAFAIETKIQNLFRVLIAWFAWRNILEPLVVNTTFWGAYPRSLSSLWVSLIVSFHWPF